MKEKIIVLGCTGSIGTQTLDVLKNNSNFELIGVSLNSNFEKLEPYLDYFPCLKTISIVNVEKGQLFKEKYQSKYNVAYGENANEILLKICDYDSVVNSIMGNDGLLPTIEVLKNNKTLYLSNKESLIIVGNIVNNLLKENKNAKLYPIDSEHVGLYKLLNYAKKEQLTNKIKEYFITASGGALRDFSKQEIAKATVHDVLNHPTWKMGSKITVDSATMVNKAFEIVEGFVLFNIPLDKLDALICYESTLHAGIKIGDEILFDYGINDMHECIKFALNKCIELPNILSSKQEEIKKYKLKQIDKDKYPLFYYIVDNFKKYSYPFMACVNTIDEIAINYFLNNKIKFIDIIYLIKEISEQFKDKFIQTENIKDILNLINEVKFQTILKLESMIERNNK